MPSEDIFIKPEPEPVVSAEPPGKKKRKLTEKQLENLAKGREKMKTKRAAEKKAKDEGKQVIKEQKKADKESSKALKEHNTIKKKAVKVKRKTMKEINKEKEKKILEKLQGKEKQENKLSGLRAECLGKAKNVEEYREIESVLNGITGDILHDEVKLKKYFKDSISKYIQPKKVKFETIQEVEEEE